MIKEITMAKKRVEIPADVSAKVLFLSDRTCCVCRVKGKPLQLHHIDENPSNNSFSNLSVLCLDCHNSTMIKGGFGRQLNSDQVILFRDDWLRIVQNSRSNSELKELHERAQKSDFNFLEYVTSLGEIYREQERYDFLANLYNSIGNYELRDKYIEIALKKDSTDQEICFFRGMQKRPDLIPIPVIEREARRHINGFRYSGLARFYHNIGLNVEASEQYLISALDFLKKGNPFAAAFYINELINKKLIESLFEEALRKATEENDLWGKVRAMQELKWDSELNKLLLENSREIEIGNNIDLKQLLARAQGNMKEYIKLSKERAKHEYVNVSPVYKEYKE
jgi:hypothetical protein